MTAPDLRVRIDSPQSVTEDASLNLFAGVSLLHRGSGEVYWPFSV